MLPTTPIPTARILADDTIQPVRPTAPVIDVLSEFVPGQKLLAQIQMQLANGAYRATIAQRDVTLALPFSAKAGDALELEVVDTKGRLAFAIAPQSTAPQKGQTSAETSISRTGLLISNLLGLNRGAEEKPERVALARGEPLADKPPAKGSDLAPLLEKALVKSGLFYESHQAKWVNSSSPPGSLLDEPQAQQRSRYAPSIPLGKPEPGAAEPAAKPLPTSFASTSNPAAMEKNPAGSAAVSRGSPIEKPGNAEGAATSAFQRAIPDEIAPLVQQQLTSLANNLYAFHGLAWPGQRIEWEILDEDQQHEPAGDGETAAPWKTRLHLSLPSLGAIDASLQLTGNDLSICLVAPNGEAAETLRSAGPQLQQRLADAGLRLNALQVEAQEPDGDAPAS